MLRIGQWLCCALWVMTLGCGGSSDGPELAYVDGKVTLGGQPLANAIVTFAPQEGRPSKGVTDASGAFQLNYTLDSPGAMLGEHSVTIVLIQPDDAEAGANGSTPGGPSLPAEATDGSLKKTIEPGSNHFDLEF